MITVTVNGEPLNLPEGATVDDLVRRLSLAGGAFAVELNRQVVPRREHGTRTVAEGDTLEVVTLVGGG